MILTATVLLWKMLALASGAFSSSTGSIRLGEIPILDPKRYLSPSQRYVLQIDPSRRHGEGEAEYRLTLDGAEVWSGRKPYTLWQAVVTDDGNAMGYAYRTGVYGAGEDAFVVALLDAGGREIARHGWKRTQHGPHGPWRPEATGMGLANDSRRLVIRVKEGKVGRTEDRFWRFRVADGAPEEESDGGADMDFRLALEGFPAHPDATRSAELVLPPRALRELSRVKLGSPDIVLEESDFRPMPRRFDHMFVDRAGRIFALDRTWKLLQAFDSNGSEIAQGRVEAADGELRLDILYSPFVDPGGGDVLLRVSGGRYARFDSTGKRVGTEEVVQGVRATLCVFQPGASRRWALVRDEPAVIAASTTSGSPESRASIRRRPDGRWLRHVHAISATEDGTFLLHDGSTMSGIPEAICVYPPEGPGGIAIELPPHVSRLVGATRNWIVLARRGGVHLLDREGERVLRIDLGPLQGGESDPGYFLSPDGRELWRIEPYSRLLTRFELP